MQLVGVLCMLMVAAAWGVPQGTYNGRFDQIDIDSLLKNDRVLTQYINCILDKGNCSPEGRELKQHLPEALSNNCSNCTNAQKNIVRKSAKHIMAKRPSDWEKIKTKYDPSGSHHTSFAAFLNEN